LTGLVPTLTVVTYNVRAAIGAGPFPPAWWRHIRRERMERIAAIIRDLHPDVVSLQEVGLGTVDGVPFEQATELAALTGLEVRYGAAHHEALVDPEDGRAVGAYLWGNAVLSRWPFLWSRLVALPTAADDDLVEPADGSGELAGVRYADAPFGVRERRSLLECEVAVGDTRVTVLATHLTHVGAAQRAGQARHIADMVASLRRRSLPKIGRRSVALCETGADAVSSRSAAPAFVGRDRRGRAADRGRWQRHRREPDHLRADPQQHDPKPGPARPLDPAQGPLTGRGEQPARAGGRRRGG